MNNRLVFIATFFRKLLVKNIENQRISTISSTHPLLVITGLL
ncbi:MAG: hypothetical protein ACJAXM_000442 [Arenicella sp.]|jgi:hypothetical protein